MAFCCYELLCFTLCVQKTKTKYDPNTNNFSSTKFSVLCVFWRCSILLEMYAHKLAFRFYESEVRGRISELLFHSRERMRGISCDVTKICLLQIFFFILDSLRFLLAALITMLCETYCVQQQLMIILFSPIKFFHTCDKFMLSFAQTGFFFYFLRFNICSLCGY